MKMLTSSKLVISALLLSLFAGVQCQASSDPELEDDLANLGQIAHHSRKKSLRKSTIPKKTCKCTTEQELKNKYWKARVPNIEGIHTWYAFRSKWLKRKQQSWVKIWAKAKSKYKGNDLEGYKKKTYQSWMDMVKQKDDVRWKDFKSFWKHYKTSYWNESKKHKADKKKYLARAERWLAISKKKEEARGVYTDLKESRATYRLAEKTWWSKVKWDVRAQLLKVNKGCSCSK
eukprot:TRINITY_DN110872_c0_g1_i1.p1 TRINITY_DN110872_c0_g1~~TRINITY_DN110872_c0_g1_i1.p1  ORF type:complete len:231 (+),score=32.36 TRINITY_DN110872_c0_g1_i1:55-747(+)